MFAVCLYNYPRSIRRIGQLEHLVDGRRLWTVKVRDMRAAAAFALSHAQASMRPFSPQKLVDEWNSLIGKVVAVHAEA